MRINLMSGMMFMYIKQIWNGLAKIVLLQYAYRFALLSIHKIFLLFCSINFRI